MTFFLGVLTGAGLTMLLGIILFLIIGMSGGLRL